jgi:molybdenum cofactor guanylyltransferase
MAATGPKVDASTAVRGCVLAGGAGTRLGGPKAAASLGGRPLVTHALDAFEAAGISAAVVAKQDTPLPELADGVEIWRESAAGFHPLSGIVEAASRMGDGVLVVCPCDLPLVSDQLLGWLASLGGPLDVVASQPLLGRYSVRLAAPLAEAVAAGRSAQATVAALGARIVSEEEVARFGDPARLLFNVNTSEDLARAEELLG